MKISDHSTNAKSELAWRVSIRVPAYFNRLIQREFRERFINNGLI